MSQENMMNVHHVNSTLSKAIALIQEGRLSEMEGEYTGHGGNISTPEYAMPGGDPERGGDGGVDNMSTDHQQFSDYMEKVSLAVQQQCNLSADAALQAIVACAGKKASEGLIPPMPSMESSAEHLATWAGAAKTAGFEGMCIAYCQDRAGG